MTGQREALRRSRLLPVVGLVITLVFAWRLSAYWRGALAARHDLSQGRYVILTYGYQPDPFIRDGTRLMRDRYGVERRDIGGCTISWSLEQWAQGYNSVSRPQITARFGKNVEDECMTEAAAAYLVAEHPQSAGTSAAP